MSEELKRSEDHEDNAYPRMQVRDCVKGSAAVKRKNVTYLPMTSGMLFMEQSSPNRNLNYNSESGLSKTQLPWYHENPAYMNYLMRARFPDLVGTILRGVLGIISKKQPEIKLSGKSIPLEDLATVCGKSLFEMYVYAVSEVMQTGKICYVLDFDDNNNFIIALYSSERNIDHKYEVIDRKKVLTMIRFIEEYKNQDLEEKVIEYKLVDGVAIMQKYKAGAPDGEEVILQYQGRTLNRLPVFFSGVTSNEADSDIIPLLGPSDIALTIFRKDADLSNAHHLTCSPTLFIFGVDNDNAPKMLGSQITVSIDNTDAKAEYPQTDTSALDHIKEIIADLREEAINFGAQILGVGKKAAESGEALSIREASGGASMITISTLAGKAINDILNYISELSGGGESTFEASIDFAEHDLDPQKIRELVAAWLDGAISHDTLLDRFRDAAIIDGDVTNNQEKNKILSDSENITGHEEPNIDNLNSDVDQNNNRDSGE